MITNEQERSIPERVVVFETNKGIVEIHANRPHGTFTELVLDDGLGKFSHYTSIIQRLDVFDSVTEKPGGKVTLAIVEPNIVIGYNVCWYPGPDERWSALGELMYEMAAVEVSRNFRSIGLSAKLLEVTLDEDFFEDKIAYMNGFSWHWDLEGSGLTGAQYRQLMMALYSRFGFREVYTNEPNIALRDENIMMIRVGTRVSAEDQKRFRYLRFGIKMDPKEN